jgi:hypothetical protein
LTIFKYTFWDSTTKTMFLTERHKTIASLFDENFWKNFQGVPVLKLGKSD